MSSRRVLIDLRPLRHSADFRRLFVGSALSQLGGQMATFAVALQVFRLTGSSAAVGGVGLAAAVPSLIVGLIGGPIIDSVDRRRLVLVTNAGLTVVSVVFAAQAYAGLGNLGLLYVLVATESALSSLNGPARRTFMPTLLAPALLPSGAALTMLAMHVSLVAGPPLAGLLTGFAGLPTCYLLDAVSFVAALYAVFRLPPMRPEGPAVARGPHAVLDGLRLVRGHPALRGALLTDLSATALAMPVALFPAINADRFGGSPETLGLLTAALATGGIVGSAFSGPVSHVARQGRAMLVCTLVWGGALTGFGLTGRFDLSLLCLTVAGVADVLSVVFRTSLVQGITPDRYRGRVSAAEYVVGVGAPQLGNFRAGMIGSLTGPGLSAAIGGASSLVGAAAIALTLPAFRTYAVRRADASDRVA